MTTIIFTEPTDFQAARAKGAECNIQLLSEARLAELNDVVVVGRGRAQDLLEAANLGATGEFVDIPDELSLHEWIGDSDLLTAIKHASMDRFWHESRPLDQWQTEPDTDGITTGIQFLDNQWRWKPSELVVICGGYGSGKSSLMRLLSFHWAHTIGRQIDAPVSLCAFEDRRAVIQRELHRWCHSHAETKDRAEALFSDMLRRVFWTERTVGEDRLLTWYIDMVRDRVRRYNIRFFVFDPWNEHDFELARNQTETNYVKEMMKHLQALTMELNIVIAVVTHISAKSYDESGDVKPFRVANAYGSSNFGAKATRGICIAKTRKLKDVAQWSSADSHMIIRTDKTKDNETMGREMTTACVFDPENMTLRYDGQATEAVRAIWP